VIDGDTVEARFPNGDIDTLRLLGVDTPETTLSRVSPEEFEGIPDTTAGRDHLFNWGEFATAFAKDKLERKTVRIEVDSQADRRGSFGRLLVYVYVDEENFNKLLLTNGYARVYESSFSKRSEFDDAEATAGANDVGLWNFEQSSTPTPTPTPTATATSSSSSEKGDLVVWEIHEDAAGNDHENLNDEYIVFKNTGDQSLDLSGWTDEDEADHTYHFPSGFTLSPGETVTLYTGSGSDTDSGLDWGSGRAIWNNGGDTIFVTDEDGNLVIKESY
jgi:endonuclease YncB( thermonuclease family)